MRRFDVYTQDFCQIRRVREFEIVQMFQNSMLHSDGIIKAEFKKKYKLSKNF